MTSETSCLTERLYKHKVFAFSSHSALNYFAATLSSHQMNLIRQVYVPSLSKYVDPLASISLIWTVVEKEIFPGPIRNKLPKVTRIYTSTSPEEIISQRHCLLFERGPSPWIGLEVHHVQSTTLLLSIAQSVPVHYVSSP
jgi:hypothetical protein